MTIRGALITKSANQTGQNISGGAFLTFNTVVYDTNSITNSSQYFVIPSAFNNAYGLLTATMSLANVTANNACHMWIAQNSGGTLFAGITWKGVPMLGYNVSGNGQSSTSAWYHVASQPVLLATNDRYEVITQNTDANVDIQKESSFGLLVLDQFANGYFVAKMNADQSGANYSTPAVISWNGADSLDTNQFHDPSGNPTQAVIPSVCNGSYMIFGANVYTTSVTNTSAFSIAIRINNSLVYNGFAGASPTSSTGDSVGAAACRTQAIQVATGDAIEVLLYCADTSITVDATRSSFYGYVVA